jgi:hypothetical protein
MVNIHFARIDCDTHDALTVEDAKAKIWMEQIRLQTIE